MSRLRTRTTRGHRWAMASMSRRRQSPAPAMARTAFFTLRQVACACTEASDKLASQARRSWTMVSCGG